MCSSYNVSNLVQMKIQHWAHFENEGKEIANKVLHGKTKTGVTDCKTNTGHAPKSHQTVKSLEDLATIHSTCNGI